MPWAIPWTDPERPIVKKLAYGALDKLISLMTTMPLNRLRRRLGLPPVGSEGFSSLRLNLVPVSPAVFPPNPLWESRHHVVGYWFANPPSEWQPTSELLEFLEGADPVILITLGAMSLGDSDAHENAGMFVEAVQRAGLRAIVQGWDAATQQMDLPSSVLAAGDVPHNWLIPQCAGVVHHGGFGTTSAALRAGVPALVIPHLADQFYWGQRVHELGVGPEAIHRAKLDVNTLASALAALLQDKSLQSTASALGEQIRTETGLQNAVRLIEETFA